MKYTFYLIIDRIVHHKIEDNNFFDGYKKMTEFLNNMIQYEFNNEVKIIYKVQK